MQVITSTLLSLMLSLTAPTHSAVSNPIALKIVQEDQLLGARTIFLTKDAVRIDWPLTDCVIISKSPFIEVTVYNKSTKQFCTEKLEKAIGDLSVAQFALTADLFDISWKKRESKTVGGMTNTVYIGALDGSGDPDATIAKGLSYCRYTVLDEPNLSKNVVRLVAAYATLPALSGLPIGLQYYCLTKEINYWAFRSPIKDDTRRTRNLLVTSKSERLPVPASLFEPLKGSRRTLFMQQVLQAQFGKRAPVSGASDFLEDN